MEFERVSRDGITVHTVPSLFEACGVGIAFTERAGGVSTDAFSSLNLASHVGDDASSVNENRRRLLQSIGVGALGNRLTTAQQVHGTTIAEVDSAAAGSGASAISTDSGEGTPAGYAVQAAPRSAHSAEARPPLPATDALWTVTPGIPLLLLYADCVPVILVRPSAPSVAVVHAGWRGLAGGIVGNAVRALARSHEAEGVLAFVGPHIGPCCYEVGADTLSHFDASLATITEASARLDLGAAVAADLERSGIPRGNQCHLGICTAHNTDRFYSYRADGRTGRHGAIAVIL